MKAHKLLQPGNTGLVFLRSTIPFMISSLFGPPCVCDFVCTHHGDRRDTSIIYRFYIRLSHALMTSLQTPPAQHHLPCEAHPAHRLSTNYRPPKEAQNTQLYLCYDRSWLPNVYGKSSAVYCSGGVQPGSLLRRISLQIPGKETISPSQHRLMC